MRKTPNAVNTRGKGKREGRRGTVEGRREKGRGREEGREVGRGERREGIGREGGGWGEGREGR